MNLLNISGFPYNDYASFNTSITKSVSIVLIKIGYIVYLNIISDIKYK